MRKKIGLITLVALMVAPSISHANRAEQGDVMLPKIQFSTKDGSLSSKDDISIPDNIHNPENFQKYLDEISQDVLPVVSAESPYAAEAWKSQDNTNSTKSATSKFAEEIASMLLDKGGMSNEDQEKVNEFIELNQNPNVYEKQNLIVFLSSSVPEVTIKNLLTQLGDSPNAVFVLRGLVGNDIEKIMPTLAWIQDLKCEGDPASEDVICAAAPFDINPLFFDWFKIEQVPALVYFPNPTVLESCGDDPSFTEEDYLVFYGDVSPLYMLNEFQKVRPEDKQLAKVIKSLTPVIWETQDSNNIEVTKDITAGLQAPAKETVKDEVFTQ